MSTPFEPDRGLRRPYKTLRNYSIQALPLLSPFIILLIPGLKLTLRLLQPHPQTALVTVRVHPLTEAPTVVLLLLI